MRRVAFGAAAALIVVARLGTAQSPQLDASIDAVRASSTDTSLLLRVSIRVPAGWHIGAPRPGAFGLPTRLEWRLPSGLRVLDERWPAAATQVIGRDTGYVYQGAFSVDAVIGRGHEAGRSPVHVVLSYLICRDVCIPGQLTLAYRQ